MFDKSKFANIIKNIKETYSSQEEFSKNLVLEERLFLNI